MKRLIVIDREWLTKVSFLGFICYLSLIVPATALQASPVYSCALQIFTSNGSFSDSDDLNFYVEVSDAGANRVDFTFYNDSLIESCIEGIYLDDGSLLGIANVTGSSGVSFSQPTTPLNLPAGNTLKPPFVASFSIDSDPSTSKNGVNPGEWLCITFDLKNNSQIQDVLYELNNRTLRIGAHILALPDGSSESAINVPEPATICLLGLGALSLIRRKRSV